MVQSPEKTFSVRGKIARVNGFSGSGREVMFTEVLLRDHHCQDGKSVSKTLVACSLIAQEDVARKSKPTQRLEKIINYWS